MLADTLFTPPLTYHGNAVPARFLGLEGGDTLVPCWAKPAHDGNGWILRLHETMGQRGKAKIKLAAGCKAYHVDVLETILPGDPLSEIDFQPYELRSVRVV